MRIDSQRLVFLILLCITAILTIIAYCTLNKHQVLYRRAETQFASQNFPEAIQLYQQAIQRGQTNPNVYLHLAIAYTAERQFEQAAEWYRRYLTIYPDDRQTRLMLARVLSYAGNFEASIKEYRKATEESHAKENLAVPDGHLPDQP